MVRRICHPTRPRVRGVPEPDDFDRLELLVAREHDDARAPHARGQPQPGPRLPEAGVGVALPGSLGGQATGRHRRSGGGEP